MHFRRSLFFHSSHTHTSQSFSANNGGPIAFIRARFSRQTIFPDDFPGQNKSGTFTGAQHNVQRNIHTAFGASELSYFIKRSQTGMRGESFPVQRTRFSVFKARRVYSRYEVLDVVFRGKLVCDALVWRWRFFSSGYYDVEIF